MTKTGANQTSDNVLVMKVRGLGDTLLATPALRALRQAYPRAGITLVVSPQGEDVLVNNPHVDRVLVYAKKDRGTTYRLMRELRSFEHDLVLALHASFRTALLARATGCARRVVHNHSGRNFFGTIPIRAKKESKSAIERDLDAIRALGLPDAGTRLEFPLKKTDQDAVSDFLDEQDLAPDRPLWVLAPGAGKNRKQWPVRPAAAFLDRIAGKLAGTWIILAGPGDEDLAEQIQKTAQVRPPIFRQSIQQAGALMARARGVITADSGPKHVAVAVGAKTLTLWTDEPEAEWHPYDSAQHALIRSHTGVVADLLPADVAEAALRHFK